STVRGRWRVRRFPSRRPRRPREAAAEPPRRARRLGRRTHRRGGGHGCRRQRRGRREHARGLRLGPGARAHRVRRAQAGIRADVVIAGAGMAGLCAAARARELGAAPIVYEKGDRPGGSMLLSSCVVWRFRDWGDFRAECPTGDERLQRLVRERLDDGIAWLEALGAPGSAHETGNPRTVGKRFEPRGLTDVLVRAADDVRLGETTDEPTVLATGGFQGNRQLVTKHIHPGGTLRLRANPWSEGDGLRFALARGAALSAGMDEF